MKNKLLFLVLIGLVISLNSCKKDDPKTNAYPMNASIKYIVTSTNSSGTASISYTNSSGGSTDINNAELPFNQTINKSVEFAEILSFSASSNNSESLTLEILVNNSSVATKTFESTSFNVGVIIYQFD